MSEIYEPEEDSFLMSETLSAELPRLLDKNPELKLLEIGCGSGINLSTALKAGVKINNILGTDVNNKAVKYCKSLGFNCIKSDLFSNVKGKYDVIVFNPPYLPYEKKEPKNSRLATSGGKKGGELIIKFLKGAKEHLTKSGKIFLITSSLSKSVDFNKLGYKSKKIAKKNLFFEKLFLWELVL